MATTTTIRGRVTPLLASVLAAGLVLAACGGDDTGTESSTSGVTATESSPDPATSSADGADGMSEAGMSESMSESMSEHDMTEGMSEDHAMATATEGAASSEAVDSAAPDVTATLADGTTITLADYAGEQLFVETFATWCSNCRRQLGDTTTAAGEAGDDATFLALSIETDLDPAALTGYAEENGFTDITFGVLDADSLVTLNDTFGNAVLVPPSTPKFVVAPDGSVSDLTTGFESVDEILAQVGGGA